VQLHPVLRVLGTESAADRGRRRTILVITPGHPPLTRSSSTAVTAEGGWPTFAVTSENIPTPSNCSGDREVLRYWELVVTLVRHA
jgi:hypothetical protein